MLETFEIAVGDVTKVAPPVSVESPPTRVSLGSSPAMEPVPETTSSTLQRWLKSAQANPTRAAVIVIIALAVLGGGGWVAFSRRPSLPLTVPDQSVAMSTTEAGKTQPTAATHTSTPPIAARASVKLLHRTDVRAGPGEEYLVFATLDEGTPVEVTGRNSKGTWWQIVHPSGPQGRGWIDADDAEEVELSVPEVSVLPPSDTPTSTVVPTPTNTPIPTSTPIPSDTPSPAPTPTPVLPGRGQGKIAFVTNRDGNNEVYVMKADGTDQTRLTYDPGDDWSPAWSSDGQRIVFTSSRDAQLPGVHNIYIMNADGGDVIRLTYNQAWDEYGAWSPDGQHIAFVSTADNNAEIFAVNTDGSNYQRLTYNQADDRNPSWSPDGRRLALASRRTGTWQIFVMDADGGNQTRLTYSDANDFDPTWSPDGSRIAFVSDRDGNAEIYVMNADGSGQTRLTDNHARDEHPTWSPDGSALAFWSNREEDRNDVYVMWADGSQQTRLTSHPASDGAPSWGK
jgi:Tol biopolymer transport system component